MGAVQNLRVCILGAGSIGCYLGGYLQSAGCQVAFIGRERIKWDFDMRGMTLTHYKRKPIHIVREDLQYQLNYDSLGEADVILVCVKSQDSASAADIIAEQALPDTLVISFQNGINNQGVIGEGSGRETLGAVVPFNVTQVQRGEFHCGTEGDLIIEDSSDPRAMTITKAFQKVKMGVKTVSEIEDYQWGKLLVNLNNALSALSGGTLREGLAQRDYRQVLASMIEEGLEICEGAGLNPKTFGRASAKNTISILRLPNALFGVVMNRVLKIDANARSSMLDDLEAGKQSEVDYLQGEIVRLAAESGQYAPINSTILHAVHAAFDENKSPFMSGIELSRVVDGLMT